MGAVQNSSGYTSVPIDSTSSDPAKPKRNMGINLPDMGLDILLMEPLARRKLQEKTETLTQKYDLRNMNRNQYSRLLAELRDAGIITTKEYSAAYGGTLPQSSSAAPHWPYGKEEIDFVHFLDACVIYCEHAADNPELTAIYTKLRGIFCHIDHAHQLVPEDAS